MPGGIPVATVALNGSKNAGILAANILGAFDESIAKKLAAYKAELAEKVMDGVAQLKNKYPNSFDEK